MHGECTFWNSPRSKIPHEGLDSISFLLMPENVSEKPAEKPAKFSFGLTFTPKEISKVCDL